MSRRFAFVGSESGHWRVTRMTSVSGDPLPQCSFVSIVSEEQEGQAALPASSAGEAAGNATVSSDGAGHTPTAWLLKGVTSNDRYVSRPEKTALAGLSQPLGRQEATCAALIPMRKSAAWWALTQDERRSIFEEQSHHIQLGMRALPAVARRLHHCRDLSAPEPFDFITWFEFSAADEHLFDQLLLQLRASIEWSYVDREVDIRLQRVLG